MPSYDNFDSLFRVRLQEQGAKHRRVIFRVTPEVIENTVINYQSIDPVHMPGGIHVYRNTQSRTFTVSNIKLISRTREEASANQQRLNMLRSWGRPRFGEKGKESSERGLRKQVNQSIAQGQQREDAANGNVTTLNDLDVLFYNQGNNSGQEFLGAPPAVLLFSAYSKEDKNGNIYKIPCVMTQLTAPWPTDVDYVPTLEGEPFPFIMTIDLTLTETHSPGEYERFSLDDFRQGNLTGF